MWTHTIKWSLFQNWLGSAEWTKGFLFRLDAHLKTSVFCHEVQLLADLRFCFIFSSILPFVDFGVWSTQSIMSICSAESSVLRWHIGYMCQPLSGLFFFFADSSVRLKCVNYLLMVPTGGKDRCCDHWGMQVKGKSRKWHRSWL